ncbi:MAG: hypothetical protein WKF66_09315 [Pedobacter sp.]
MIRKRSLLTFLFVTVLGFLAFVPRDDDPLDKLVAALQKWTEINAQEKVYLHMDKPYYALGDTIWFKAYVVTGSRHQLSALSGALYVDLITEKDSIVKSLKLPVSAGMSMGDFTLEDDLREGNYRIRAYTQWMRNAGEDYFFDRTFTVGTPVSNEVLVKSAYNYTTVEGKQVLTALLNYTDDEGKALSGREVQYDIMVDKQRVHSKSARTDSDGNISIAISNTEQSDLRGAYIRTVIESDAKKKVVKDFPIKAGMTQTDVQFFPESGNLVNGILSRVAFKATGIDGIGLSVKGKVFDNENKEVVSIETMHAGMGSFLLNPEAGKTYTAKLSFPDGSEKVIPLPKANDDGYVLSVYQPNQDSILVRVSTSPALLKVAAGAPINVNIIAQTGGETVVASPVKIERQLTSFWLQKSAFPSGIVQFTLFSNTGEPLNERLAFIKTKDRMQLKLSSAKSNYKSKEKVDLELEARDRNDKMVAGNFSVTVIDESKVPMNEDSEHTIFSDLLLTSDLKGYVEKPNYYFSKETEEVNKALDNLMLTQGYRRFLWKELAADPSTAYLTDPMFKKESLGTDISGVVKTLGDKIVSNAKITLVSTKIGVFETATADANGRFKFEGLVLTDSIKFTVQAKTEKNGTKVEVVLDSVPKLVVNKNKNIGDVSTNIPYLMKAYIDNSKKLDDFYEKTGQLNRVQKLREVNITARKKPVQTYAAQGQLRIPDGHSDQTLVIERPELCATLGICLQGRLGGILFGEYKCSPYSTITNYPIYRTVPMLTILDGRSITDCDELSGIYDGNVLDPMDIVKIEVVRTNFALMATVSRDGVPVPALFIYTRRGLQKKQYVPNVANISPKGFNKAREFYTPRYDRPGSENTLPDYRSTVYWNANLKTYSTGKASFSYFNADGPGNYKVIIEGINAEGELGREVYRYKVDAAENEPIQAFAYKAKSDTITSALNILNKALPIEKVYLHTDKPYYLVGDTIWFKAYVASGSNHLPSTQSGTLYVDLITEGDSILQTRKLELTSGTAKAEFMLDDSTAREGNYRIRAYTQWMRNAGPEYFYDRTFIVGNAVTNNVFSKISYRYKEGAGKGKIAALVKYADEKGEPFAEKEVDYQLTESYKTLVSSSGKTNSQGELLIDLPETKDVQLNRPYLSTQLNVSKNQVIPKTFSIRSGNPEPDFQFFPEGGVLLNDVRHKIAFKVAGIDGLGMTVSGIVVDSDGKTVAQIQTQHLGMGAFTIMPESGKTYTAKVKFADGSERSYTLPAASDSGYALAISPKGRDSIAVTVNVGRKTFQLNQILKVVGQSNQTAWVTRDVSMDKSSSTLFLPVKDYPSGLTQFTLFSQDLRPLNERLVFLQNRDTLTLNVFEMKTAYAQKEKVAFQLEAKGDGLNGVPANLSVSVVSETSVPSIPGNENSIFAQLLLSADLKGYIEKPNYYFTSVSDTTRSHLDLLMLTQGYRRFIWKDVIASTFKPAQYNTEKVVKTITGSLRTLNNKVLPDGKVMLFNNKNGAILTAITNSEGRFSFDNVSFTKDAKFTIQGRTTTGGKNVITLVDEVAAQSVTPNINIGDLSNDIAAQTKVSLEAAKAQDLELDKDGKVSKARQLREVQIKSVKKWSFGNKISDSQADQVFRPDSSRPCATLMECLIEMDRNSSVSFKQEMDDSERKCGMLNVFMSKEAKEYTVLIDNMLVKRCDYQDLLLGTPMSIEKILFSHQSAAISARLLTGYYRGGIPPPVIAIYTKNGNFRAGYDPSIATYSPRTYDVSKEFYLPRYDVVSDSTVADLRSTIYWNPSIITVANGRIPVNFFNGDRLGAYRVTIEGIGKNGFLGRKVFRYEVMATP